MPVFPLFRRTNMLRSASLMLPIAILTASCLPASAVTAPAMVFAGAQSTLGFTGLKSPAGVAVDSAGNVYVADSGNSRLVKLWSTGVQNTISTGDIGVSNPTAITLDAAGNLFVADTGDNRVIEISANGMVTVVASGLAAPQGVAVDSAGVLYIADTGNNQIVKIFKGTRTTLISKSQQVNGLALNKPMGLSVVSFSPGIDELYVADNGNNRVFSGSTANSPFDGYDWAVTTGLVNPVSVVPGVSDYYQNRVDYGPVTYIAQTLVPNYGIRNMGVISASTYGTNTEFLTPVLTGSTVPGGMTMDSAGNLYVADAGNNRIVKLATSPSYLFSWSSVGATSAVATFNFSFPGLTTWHSPYVVTQGATVPNSPGLDFQYVATTGSSACPLSEAAYAPQSICNLSAQMKPLATGERMGAVIVSDDQGDAVTVYLHGLGFGPQIVFDPGVQTTLATGLVDPRGIAVDGNGNVYVADFGDGKIVKITPSGTKSTFATIGSPLSLAIDGAGTLYTVGTYGSYTDSVPLAISRSGVVSYAGGNSTDSPFGVAVDGAGDLFLADIMDHNVYENSPTFGELAPVTGGFTPSQVAADGWGSLFIVDSDDWLVWKHTQSGAWSTVGSGYNRPQGLAVDQGGNVFVADFGNNQVVKVSQGGVQSTVGTGIVGPSAVAVDASGNLYITELGSGSVIKINRNTSPSLTFASTPVGKTSSDSPKPVTVENIGPDVVAFASLSTGANPSLSAGFTLGSATNCPRVGANSATAYLLSESQCTYFVSFTPTAKGSVSGSLVMTDNNLNVTKATQTISLTGSATAATAAVKLSGLSQTFTGSPVQVAATSNPAGLKLALTYNGKTTAPTAAGNYTVAATIADANYQGSATGTLTIAKATPAIAWTSPAAITSGTALTTKQLDASSTVPGKFVYSPALGTKPAKGTVKLSVTFTPSDAANFKASTATVNLTVK
jgi:sugar lactone lactonase YvrE